MKGLLLILTLFTRLSWAINCPPGTMQVWSQGRGPQCMPRVLLPEAFDPYGCFSHSNVGMPDGFKTWYGASYRGGNSIWWAAPAKMYYPNVEKPGPWSFPYIQSHYYPGEGQVFAAKPNVYIQSVHEKKSFEFKFEGDKKLSFLATTPPLQNDNLWKGKIIEKDKFEVEGIPYDYLFYDLRLPKEKMQFERGLCSNREGVIEWMLTDLKEMTFSPLAVQDFEEHWRVKIPDHPFYCIYPQYNNELDAALPISISTEQTTFTRVLYVLVPFQKEPDMENPHPDVPYPQKDPKEMQPSTKITRENMFREWGVAFLGTE